MRPDSDPGLRGTCFERAVIPAGEANGKPSALESDTIVLSVPLKCTKM